MSLPDETLFHVADVLSERRLIGHPWDQLCFPYFPWLGGGGGGHALSFLWVFFLGREASGRQYGISSALAVDLGEGEPFQLILSPSVSTRVTTWL